MSDNNKRNKPAKRAQDNSRRAMAGGAITYLGPTIKGIARHGSTYLGGLPKKLRELIEKDGRFGELCVETQELPNAMKQLSTDGSVLNSIYESIVRG